MTRLKNWREVVYIHFPRMAIGPASAAAPGLRDTGLAEGSVRMAMGLYRSPEEWESHKEREMARSIP